MESVFLLVVQVRLLLWCDVYCPDESERVVDWWQFETDSPIHANHLEMFAPLRLKDEETIISKESVRSDKSWQIPCFFGDAGVSLPQWRQEWFWIWIDFLPLLRGWRTYSSLKDYLCQFAIKLQFWQHFCSMSSQNGTVASITSCGRDAPLLAPLKEDHPIVHFNLHNAEWSLY